MWKCFWICSNPISKNGKIFFFILIFFFKIFINKNWKNNKNLTSFALRSGIIQALSYQHLRNDFSRGSQIYYKLASSIENLSSLPIALLFEQCAFCYWMLKKNRKFAFFLILAGYRFSHVQQFEHSYRCYKISLPIYYEKSWSQIFNHLSITMARFLLFIFYHSIKFFFFT